MHVHYLSVAGLKQITSPIDILNKDDFEQELEKLGSLRAKADAISGKEHLDFFDIAGIF